MCVFRIHAHLGVAFLGQLVGLFDVGVLAHGRALLENLRQKNGKRLGASELISHSLAPSRLPFFCLHFSALCYSFLRLPPGSPAGPIGGGCLLANWSSSLTTFFRRYNSVLSWATISFCAGSS